MDDKYVDHAGGRLGTYEASHSFWEFSVSKLLIDNQLVGTTPFTLVPLRAKSNVKIVKSKYFVKSAIISQPFQIKIFVVGLRTILISMKLETLYCK